MTRSRMGIRILRCSHCFWSLSLCAHIFSKSPPTKTSQIRSRNRIAQTALAPETAVRSGFFYEQTPYQQGLLFPKKNWVWKFSSTLPSFISVDFLTLCSRKKVIHSHGLETMWKASYLPILNRVILFNVKSVGYSSTHS